MLKPHEITNKKTEEIIIKYQVHHHDLGLLSYMVVETKQDYDSVVKATCISLKIITG